MNGAIRWMINNGVTANLLMLFILVAGAFGAISLRKQVFPEFSPDLINISVAYPGASPVEVEEAIVIPIEAALESLDAAIAQHSDGGAVDLASLKAARAEF